MTSPQETSEQRMANEMIRFPITTFEQSCFEASWKKQEDYYQPLLKAKDEEIAKLSKAKHVISEEYARLSHKHIGFVTTMASPVGTVDLLKRIDELTEALKKIANMDYRGNRSTESQIAYAALSSSKEEKDKKDDGNL